VFDFCSPAHYSRFIADSQGGSLYVFPQPKLVANINLAGLAGVVAKNRKQEYTPALACPPSQKVSQVEIEAGDSEGRLPQLFSAALCAKLDAR
jgi:hypothetical protein